MCQGRRLTIWSYGMPVFRCSFSKCRNLDPGYISIFRQRCKADSGNETGAHGVEVRHGPYWLPALFVREQQQP